MHNKKPKRGIRQSHSLGENIYYNAAGEKFDFNLKGWLYSEEIEKSYESSIQVFCTLYICRRIILSIRTNHSKNFDEKDVSRRKIGMI